MSKPNLPPLQFPTSIGLGVVPPNKEQRRQEILALREPVTHNDAAFLRNSSSMPHGAQPYKPIKAVKKHCQRVKRKVDHKLKELARAIDLDEDADRPEEILDAAREKLLELEQRCKQMTEEAQRRGGVGSTSTESLAEDGDDGEGKSPRSSNNGGGMMTPTSPRSTNSVPTRSPRSSVRRGSPRSTNSLPAHLPSDIEAHILDDDFSDAASTTSSLHMSEEAEAKRKSLHARFQLLRESVGEQDTCMVKVLGTALTKLNQYQKRCKALEDEAKRLEQSNDNNNCNACRSKSFFAKFWRHRHSHPAPAATNAPPPPPPPPSAGRQSFYMPSQSAGPPPPVPPRPRQYSAMAGAPQYMFPQQPQLQPQSSMEIMDISDMDSELQHSTAQLNGLSLGQSNSNSSIPSSSSSSSQLHHQQQQQQHQQQQHQQQQYCGVPLSSSDSVMNGSATPGGSEGEGAAPIIREEVSYHSVFAQGVVAMAVTSLDGRFIDGNGEFMQLTGYTNQELKSLTIFSIMDSADMADMYTRIPAVVAGTQSRFDKVCTIAVKAGRGGDGGQLSPSSHRNNNNMRQSLCSPTLSQCVKDCKTRPLRVRIRGNVVKEPNNRFFLFVFTEVAQ